MYACVRSMYLIISSYLFCCVIVCLAALFVVILLVGQLASWFV
jgi:hypothetical protein